MSHQQARHVPGCRATGAPVGARALFGGSWTEAHGSAGPVWDPLSPGPRPVENQGAPAWRLKSSEEGSEKALGYGTAQRR